MTKQGPRARARKHDWIDERSLALAQAVAQHVRRDPSLILRARGTVNRWGAMAKDAGDAHVCPLLASWHELLTTGTLEEILAALLEESDRGRRLRQSSPFAGLLPDDERSAIFARYEAL